MTTTEKKYQLMANNITQIRHLLQQLSRQSIRRDVVRGLRMQNNNLKINSSTNHSESFSYWRKYNKTNRRKI